MYELGYILQLLEYIYYTFLLQDERRRGKKETGGKTTRAKERGVGETGAKETGGKQI